MRNTTTVLALLVFAWQALAQNPGNSGCDSEAESSWRKVFHHQGSVMEINWDAPDKAGKLSRGYLATAGKLNREYVDWLLTSPDIKKLTGVKVSELIIENNTCDRRRNRVLPRPVEQVLQQEAGEGSGGDMPRQNFRRTSKKERIGHSLVGGATIATGFMGGIGYPIAMGITQGGPVLVNFLFGRGGSGENNREFSGSSSRSGGSGRTFAMNGKWWEKEW